MSSEDTQNSGTTKGDRNNPINNRSASLDGNEPKRVKNHITEYQAKSIAGWKVDEEDLRLHIESFKDTEDEKDRRKMKALQKHLDRGTEPPSVFRTNGRRVYNLLTAMKRTMRHLITAQSGAQLLEIDAKNSQPLLLVFMMIKADLPVERELREAVESGMFYELFMKGGEDREKVKVEVFKFLFTKDLNKRSRIFNILMKEFPWFTTSLEEFAKGKSLAMLLLTTESGIWIDKVSAACLYLGIHHATIHDSVVFEDVNGAAGKVLSVIEAAYVGVELPLHTKTLDGKSVVVTDEPNPKWGAEQIRLGQEMGYRFWSLNPKSGKLVFQPADVFRLLHHRGVRIHYLQDMGTYIYVQKVKNIIAPIDVKHIKDLLLDFAKEYGGVSATLVPILPRLVTPETLHTLRVGDFKIYRGDPQVIYIYYSDAVARVSASGITRVEYEDLEHVIWRRAVLDRPYPVGGDENGEFKKFFDHVIKHEGMGYTRSVLGYVLQRYKGAQLRAVVLTDTNPNAEARGGTGKSLIAKALSYMIPTVVEDGRGFKPTSQFAYQAMQVDTRLFVIDDVGVRFRFELLFGVVTDAMPVEKKGKDKYTVEQGDLPTFLITANHGISGSDPSHVRRRYDIGLVPYYTVKKTPEMEFGHWFFAEWGAAEWAGFDLFMLGCARMFLKGGVPDYEDMDVVLKQLVVDTDEGFVEYAERFVCGVRYDKDDVLDKVVKTIGGKRGVAEVTKAMLTRWVGKFATYKGWKFKNSRMSSGNFYLFGTEKVNEEEDNSTPDFGEE